MAYECNVEFLFKDAWYCKSRQREREGCVIEFGQKLKLKKIIEIEIEKIIVRETRTITLRYIIYVSEASLCNLKGKNCGLKD